MCPYYNYKGETSKKVGKKGCVPSFDGVCMATKKVVKKRGKRDSAGQADSGRRAEERRAKTGRKVVAPLPQERQRSLGELRKRLKEVEKQNEQLRETQKRLEYLASFPEMNPNPVVGVTVDGSVQYLNPAARRLFPDLQSTGLRHEWLVDVRSIVTLLKDKKKTSYIREVSLGNAWFEQLFFLTSMQDQIRVYGRDITEHKRAEESLAAIRAEAENEKHRLEAVMEALPVGVAITDADGGTIRVNEAFDRVWGNPRPVTLSVSDYAAYKAWWPDSSKPVAPDEWASAQAVQKGRPVVGQLLEIQRFDGSRASVINSGAPIFDVDGKITGCAVAIQDITDLQKAENALQRSEKRYRSYIELTEQLGWTTNADGEVVEDMPSWRRFTAQSEEEIKGWGWSNALHPDDRERVAQIWKTAVAMRSNYEVEYRIRRHDGIYRHFLVRGVPVLREDGTIQEWVGVCIDITERKQMEEELRKSRDESEITVQERTAELAKANELLERMFSSVDISIAYMDKEFNFIRVNPAYAEADGREPGFYVGKNHFALFPNAENEQIFRNVVETGEIYSVFAKPFKYYEHPERGLTYWDWSLQPVKNPDGAVTGVVLSLVDVTERMRAQESVEAERRRFNNVLEVLPAYLVLLAPDYHVPFANRFFRERFGEAHGRRCFEYLFGRSEPCQVCESYTPLRTTAPHHWEWTGPDGCIYDVFDFPFTDADGSTLILEMGIDITKRKQAEEAQKAASLYTRSLIEASLDPLVTISPDGKIMDVNHATEFVTGVSREDLVGTDFSNYFTDPEAARKGYRQVFSDAFVRDYPLALRHTSGRVTEVLYNATVYKSEKGEVQGVLAAARDVTERKRVEEALKERDALLRTMFEALPLGLWIADKEGRIIDGNQAGQQIWAGARYVGIDQFHEYKGWWLDSGRLIEPEDWAVARAVRNGETSINEEIEIECFDGSHKIILNSAVPIRSERHEILGAFIVNEDITDRKRAEKNLQQTQKMEALGTLAGGVAHDFNNILMPITINTELALLDTPEGNPLCQYLQPVLDAAKRGKDLVGQIITFSRQREAERKPVKVGPIVREAIQFLRSSLPRNIEIQDRIETESDTVLGDATQIHQVLMNLSSNAAYAMREKGGILDVRLTGSDVDSDLAAKYPALKEGPHVKLTISDTGCGMSREVVERVFDPFFTTKKPGEGTGMGLAVVHGIVKNHKGAITVYSEMGKGTTFNIFLPRIQDEIRAESGSLESIPAGRERILVVDDEEPQLQSVTRMLEKLGYNVVAKTDSLEALDLFQSEPDAFDLVITDQTMPKMTGDKLVRSILSIRPDIPVILCTGFSEVIDADEAKALGIREFVMKPFTVREMAEKIRKGLGK
jgi:PAS domain S-box-containing protein